MATEMDEALRTPEVVAAEFGWAAAFLEDPELGPLLQKAAKEGWTEAKLQTELMKTKWWKNSDNAQRAWAKLEAQGDGESNRQVNQKADEVREIAAQLGGMLTDSQLIDVSTAVLRFGFNAQQTMRMVANELLRGSDPASILRTGIVGQSVRQIARQMGLPMSNETLDEYSRKIATGTALLSDFENYARRQAKSLYPSLEADLDRGLSVDAIADPYRQYAANLLGISPTSIDFADPKWNIALNYADEKGRRAMTLQEWGDRLRRDESYGWQYTDQAINRAYDVTSMIARAFGRL